MHYESNWFYHGQTMTDTFFLSTIQHRRQFGLVFLFTFWPQRPRYNSSLYAPSSGRPISLNRIRDHDFWGWSAASDLFWCGYLLFSTIFAHICSYFFLFLGRVYGNAFLCACGLHVDGLLTRNTATIPPTRCIFLLFTFHGNLDLWWRETWVEGFFSSLHWCLDF